MCKAMALFYVFTGSDSTSLKFKGKRSRSMLMHSPMCNYCRHSIPNIAKVETRKNWQQTLSIGCTQTNLTITSFNADLVRMRLFSQTTRDVEIIPQLRIHLINISKWVSLKRVAYLGNSPHVYVYFQFGLRCRSPRMCSTCM